MAAVVGLRLATFWPFYMKTLAFNIGHREEERGGSRGGQSRVSPNY